MKTAKKTATGSAPAVRKKKARKSEFDELATCPVNGAGWCPYPFSIAQLKRRLKAKAALAKLEN